MKKILLSIFIVLCCLSQASAWMNVATVAGGGQPAVTAGPLINEDFADCTDWTDITQTVSCSSSAAHGTAWAVAVAYHETATGSNDHWVSATCAIDAGGYDSACLIFGSNGTQYYYASFSAGTFYIRDYQNNWTTSYAGSYGAGTHTVAIQIDTSSSHARFNAWVDGVQRITDQSDAGDNVTRGQYVGVRIDRDNANADITVTALTADSGTYTP